MTLTPNAPQWPEERMDNIGRNGNDGGHYRPTGRKFDVGKPRMDLLIKDTPLAVEAVGQVLTFGAEKYAPGNWQHVDDADARYLAAQIRHELALAKGETLDAETELHHLAHAACCLLFRLELALREVPHG